MFSENEVVSLADFGVHLMSGGFEKTRRDLKCDASVADILDGDHWPSSRRTWSRSGDSPDRRGDPVWTIR